jgi:hypothetical protein
MKNFIVLLEDGTVGVINSDTLDGQHASAWIGEVVNVHLYDDNGTPIEAEGTLTAVLDTLIS